jgi:hypothetical protein
MSITNFIIIITSCENLYHRNIIDEQIYIYSSKSYEIYNNNKKIAKRRPSRILILTSQEIFTTNSPTDVHHELMAIVAENLYRWNK